MASTKSSSRHYVMDDPREGARLAAKVDADAWCNRYLTPRVSPGAYVVDIGCGSGAILSAAAKLWPTASFQGFDISNERLHEARERGAALSNAQFSIGSATACPSHSGCADLIYCRFLLQYMSDPLMAIQEMVRVCRPGGQVLLQDLDGQLIWHYPVDIDLESGVHRVLEALAQTGFDPLVGRKLFNLAHRAGLEDLQVSIEPYHLFAGTIDDTNFQLWELKLDIILPVAAKALGGMAEASALKQRFLDFLRRDDTLTYSVVVTVSGTKPR